MEPKTRKHLKVVKLPIQQPSDEDAVKALLVKTLRQIASGELKGIRSLVMIAELPCADCGDSNYRLRTSGLDESNALWMLEMGKRALLDGE